LAQVSEPVPFFFPFFAVGKSAPAYLSKLVALNITLPKNRTACYKKCLEDILINKLEVDYDSTNKEYLEDLQQICKEIIQVYKTAKPD